VTITWPGSRSSGIRTCPYRPNHRLCAATMSSVVSSFHIGLLAGTQRIVAACPQNRMSLHSGRISGDISVMSK
jgi:hypothetical protein